MSNDVDTLVGQAVDFLQVMRPGGPWNLTAIIPDTPGAESIVARTAEEALSWLARRAGRANLYYAPNPAPQPTGAGGRARKADVTEAQYLHVDLDVDKEVNDLALDDRKARKVRQLQAFSEPGPPTFIVDSGGGIQAMWRVEGMGIEKAERANQRLIEVLGGDAGTWNIDRLLRLPGPPNLPDAKKRARGRITVPARLLQTAPNNSYLGIEFSLAAPASKAVEEIEFGPPEDVEDLEDLVDERLFTIIRDGRLEEPKEGDDSRSAWLFDGVCGMLRAGLAPEQVLGVITDSRWSISESVLERGDDAMRYAEHTVTNALARIRAEGAFTDEAEGVEPTPARASRFRRWSISDLVTLPPPSWLVANMVPEGGLVQVYGRRKSNKTFVTLDLCLCIATGRPFHGTEVKRGRITYVIGEGGGARFGDRVMAWCRHNRVDPKELDGWFSVVPVRVAVDSKEDLRDFLSADAGPCDLVIFDTVARSMDGDENSTADMNRFVKGLDRVREQYSGTVLVVHHSGKDEGKQGRGSTALPGAVDATIKVGRNAAGQTVVEVEEIRDAAPGTSFTFEPVNVIVGEDLRTSLAMKQVGARPPEGPKTARDLVLVRVAEAGRVGKRADLIDPSTPGMSKANVNKAIASLLEDQLLVEDAGGIRVTEAGEDLALALGAALPP